jgi:prepilin-type processing-associated H-X9-DG protein/prepilin-type N-terminal cleavage/methylation domain-containing protein
MRRTAFTLVEILVVIGIIGLLVSILLPVLSRARRAAIAIQCQSNLRQLGTANLMYSQENRGWYVPLRSTLASLDRPRWMENKGFCEFLNVRVDESTTPVYTPYWRRQLLCSLAIRAQQEAGTIGIPPSEAGNYGWIQFSYGYNYSGKPWGDATSTPPQEPPLFRNTQIRNSSEKIWFADSVQWNMVYSNSMNYSDEGGVPSNAQIAYRHNNGVNILFADGHVGWMGRRQVDTSYLSTTERDQLWVLTK